MAIFSLVPTPSVVETSTGSVKPAAFRSNSAPKPPKPPMTPARVVALASGLIASTSASPASISTPASRYVTLVMQAPDALSHVPWRCSVLKHRRVSSQAVAPCNRRRPGNERIWRRDKPHIPFALAAAGAAGRLPVRVVAVLPPVLVDFAALRGGRGPGL